MGFQEIADLARSVATADVKDPLQLGQILQQLQQVWRDQTEHGSTAEIDGYFETAAELAQVLAQDRPLTVEEILTLITRLVARIECAVARAGIPRKAGGVVLKLPDQVEESDLRLVGTSGGPILNDMALGSLMVQLGTLTEEQLDEALDAQRGSGLRIGEVAVQRGYSTAEQIEEVTELQRHLREHSRAGQSRGEAMGIEDEPIERDRSLLGEILVWTGAITREQLGQGLLARRASGVRLGEALVQIGACGWSAIRQAVRTQERMRQQLRPAARAKPDPWESPPR